MKHEIVIPISWTDWDSGPGISSVVYIDGIFREAWGPWAKGHRFEALCIDYGEGKIEEYRDKQVYTSCLFKFQTR